MPMIPYGRQSIDEDDVAAVVDVLNSDFLTQGPTVERFESAIARRTGAPGAVASNSATSSLHVAYAALGCGPGDRVWTTPITFVATANAALYCGAEVDFIDVEPETACLQVSDLADRLVRARADDCLPKVVAPVHFTGHPCDMEEIAALANEFGFYVVEDAAHAFGASINNEPVGSCQFSDACVFSFHPVKILTTGEGGAATAREPELLAKMKRLVSHGISRDPALISSNDEGPWYYEQMELGFNYRMTDIHAALGLSQMDRVDTFIEKRRALVARYEMLLADIDVIRSPIDKLTSSSWHLYVIRIPGGAGRRRVVFERLRARGLGVQVHYIPVHLQPFYQARGFSEGDFPNAEKYYAGAISLPLYPDLTTAQQDEVITILKEELAAL
jgi:UDP-4-amino-4,6-dideoxy-N-acetyl-beta-L-altrosamine transaminase